VETTKQQTRAPLGCLVTGQSPISCTPALSVTESAAAVCGLWCCISVIFLCLTAVHVLVRYQTAGYRLLLLHSHGYLHRCDKRFLFRSRFLVFTVFHVFHPKNVVKSKVWICKNPARNAFRRCLSVIDCHLLCIHYCKMFYVRYMSQFHKLHDSVCEDNSWMIANFGHTFTKLY